MAKLTIDDLDLSKKRVLVRVDFNVPLNEGHVTDETRIRAVLPTLKKILDSGGSAILLSHLGRPGGTPKSDLSLACVIPSLSVLLKVPVLFSKDCIGPEAQEMARRLSPGEVLLLENLRFHPEEEKNDSGFASQLKILGDEYVNDAFGTAHRAHASTAALPGLFDRPAAGYLMQRELEVLGAALNDPRRPFIAIIGGAKISGKIDVVTRLLKVADRVLIGGGMAFTFLKSKGLEIGKSLLEESRLQMAGEILAAAGSDKLLLPVDCVVARDIETARDRAVVPVDRIPKDFMGLDIGPATIDLFAARLEGASTIVWNGPMGVFEKKEFSSGTCEIAKAVACATDEGATSIIGGGDSAAAVALTGTADRMTHISTGGGASLEFMEGKVLPGVDALADKE